MAGLAGWHAHVPNRHKTAARLPRACGGRGRVRLQHFLPFYALFLNHDMIFPLALCGVSSMPFSLGLQWIFVIVTNIENGGHDNV